MDCARTSCDDCRYCYNIADKAVRIKKEELKVQLTKYDAFLDDLVSGKVFEKEAEYHEDKELVWQSDARKLHEDILEAVPSLLKKIAQRKTQAGAEKSARDRRSDTIISDDVLKGWLTETPGIFMPKVKERLKELGIEELKVV